MDSDIMTLEEVEPQSVSLSVSDLQEMIYHESTVGAVMQVVEQGVAEKLIRSDIPVALVAHTLWMSVLSVIRFVSMEKDLFKVLELSPVNIFESHFELV